MLVFQPLQSGGRNVVFDRWPSWLWPRSSERPLFSNLPWDFVYLWVTQSRKAHASDLIIPRTVNVTHAR